MNRKFAGTVALAAIALFNPRSTFPIDAFVATDPGVRPGASAGGPMANLTPTQLQFFRAGEVEFAEAESVADGLGPRLNLDNCLGCHAHPTAGGSSPALNPQLGLAKFNRVERLPSFVTLNGPVRVARLIKSAEGVPDGSVHAVFAIAGRPDASGCTLPQPDFANALEKRNVSFRIPTPLFGAGLIEQIPDQEILANHAAHAAQNKALGIFGRPHRIVSGQADPNEAPIGRFGWKGHNTSLLVAGAEAYNDEMGITNEIFQNESFASAACPYVTRAQDLTGADALPSIDTVRRYRNPMGHRYPLDTDALRERLIAFAARNPPGNRDVAHNDEPWLIDTVTSVEKFAFFMRFLAPPAPSPDTPGGPESIAAGKSLFTASGCAACHTPALRTGSAVRTPLRNQRVDLYSDLLLHDMGAGLADGVTQGAAGPRQFRTAPLWGLGQRLFLLHDGRTSDLLVAIQEHQSGSAAAGDASEANTVVGKFNALTQREKQHVLNFLRSL